MADELTKPSTGGGVAIKGGSISITGKRNTSALHERLNDAVKAEKANAALDPLTAEYRIAIMADCSGSMSGLKIQSLKDALTGFLQMCNMGTTSIAINTFPERGTYPISRDKMMITTAIMGLSAGGGTPMSDAMTSVIGSVPLTRGILISDGCADNPALAKEIALQYAEQETCVDCVHIGDDSFGEDLLKEIAKLTGGAYIKFTDIGSFAKSFAYLTPAKRGELKAAIAGLLGAKEVIV